ncbi:MAG TPA: MBL fold metallo-hydrolase [Acidimicrobiia bacterium]|jgi:glyoxylase-like metal-dependent hydrolase (beta-lactamase superfamily II)
MTTPQPQSLGNGIYLIPAPLPFKSPAWVNTYVIEANGGFLLLDCGTDWEPGRDAIRDGFEQLGLESAAVHTLAVSHLHPDHVGMSARIVRELGCRLVMHENAEKMVERYNDTPGYVERLLRIGRTYGVPHTILDTVSADLAERPSYMPLIDPPDHTVRDGGQIDIGDGRWLEVIHTPGHDSAHICLRDSRTGVLFSGDHILPRISPVIMWDDGLGDPLGDYLVSLQRLLAMDIEVTYPAHGTLMENGDERAKQILLHHDRRLLDMTEVILDRDSTAWEVMLRSFRPNLTPLEARLAFLETISHLEHLKLVGKIRVEQREDVLVFTR